MRLGNPEWLLCLPGVRIITLHTHHLPVHVALTRKTNRRCLGAFQKKMLFRKSKSNGWKNTPTFFSPGVLSAMQETEIGSTMKTVFDNKKQTYEVLLISHSCMCVGSCRCTQNVIPCHTGRRTGTRLVAANGSLNTLP